MHKNFELSISVLKLLDSIINAAKELKTLVIANNQNNSNILINNIKEALQKVYVITFPMKLINKKIVLSETCKNAIISLQRLSKFISVDFDKSLNKIEFELIPILKIAYIQFYCQILKETNLLEFKNFLSNDLMTFFSNPYVEESEKIKSYKYDLSIVITAYNKLDYTKKCVESVLNFLPKNYTYELIYFNHGSLDDTKLYFESMKPQKQLDIAVNGTVPAIITTIYEGKYILGISNDVIVTENAIENMLKTIESDQTIGQVVPATPNVSNLQTIPSTYKNIEEMHKFAEKNNIWNTSRHEQRVRLCNPIVLNRSILVEKLKKEMFEAIWLSDNVQSFPDDKHSLWYRRNGYKLILAKDAFCYHAGSVTLKSEIKEKNEQYFYETGRKEFIKLYGIDPWGLGFCYSPELFKYLPCIDKEKVQILGINCGLGSNPLKVKETIRENTGNNEIKIFNFTNNSLYILDLNGVSDQVKYYKNNNELFKNTHNNKFNYIIFEQWKDEKEFQEILKKIDNILCDNGYFCIKTNKKELIKFAYKKYQNFIILNNWIIIRGKINDNNN